MARKITVHFRALPTEPLPNAAIFETDGAHEVSASYEGFVVVIAGPRDGQRTTYPLDRIDHVDELPVQRW